MAETPERIDDGIWRWTARHPEWHPAGFGDEVACFALKTDSELLLIDPLLPADPAPIHELVDAEAGEHGIAVLVTIPYHVRDAERLRRRHGGRCTIWGHEACASRLAQRSGFRAITPQTDLPAGVRAHAIGSPRRQEQPLWKNKAQLKAVLLYHVVKGKVTAAQASMLTSAKTLEGAKVPIRVSSTKVYVGGALVTKADVMTSNGVIHVINKVLIPPKQ